jgi:PAS domain S-box-containing protein
MSERASKSNDWKVDPAFHRDWFRVLIQDVADGFYETDPKGNFTFFNNAFCRIFGYRRNEMLNHNFRQFMDAENIHIALTHFQRIYRTGKKKRGILWNIVRKDGARRTLEISASLIVNPAGEKTGFQGIARDVTEKLAYEKALQDSEQCTRDLYQASRQAERRYRAFLKFLPDPVFVFNLDGTVSYLNPAFEKVFGWTLTELEGQRIPFVPEDQKDATRKGIERLWRQKVIHGFEARRLTKDGRVLDVLIDGAIFYDNADQPAGQVITLRDITREKRVERINQTLFRIAQALHQFRQLDRLLDYITRQVQQLVEADGASVILLDEEHQEFYFPVAAYEDTETGRKMREIRFPADKGVAAHVYRTGEALIVPDTDQSPYFFKQVDEQSEYRTRNMLDVPLRIQDRMIGVLCAVNKKSGPFDQQDVDLLNTIASLVALPIENARINAQLQRSYDDVQRLNRAKDQVIHHLSHELKTPVSVLGASVGLLRKRLGVDPGLERILDRAQRNLARLLDMQYEIEDLLRERDSRAYHLLTGLLAACSDEIEALVAEQTGSETGLETIRQKIEALFGPTESACEAIDLGGFVKAQMVRLRPKFAHRKVRVTTHLNATLPIWIPGEVLAKILEGLVRNAVENTPDGSRVRVSVGPGKDGPELEIRDYGVGIPADRQRLIFQKYFAPDNPLGYSSKQPYDFKAGGKGFDLIRMILFSERYHFQLKMNSQRCRCLSQDEDLCPGRIDDCPACRVQKDCLTSGGTVLQICFLPADVTRQRMLKDNTSAVGPALSGRPGNHG